MYTRDQTLRPPFDHDHDRSLLERVGHDDDDDDDTYHVRTTTEDAKVQCGTHDPLASVPAATPSGQ